MGVETLDVLVLEIEMDVVDMEKRYNLTWKNPYMHSSSISRQTLAMLLSRVARYERAE